MLQVRHGRTGKELDHKMIPRDALLHASLDVSNTVGAGLVCCVSSARRGNVARAHLGTIQSGHCLRQKSALDADSVKEYFRNQKAVIAQERTTCIWIVVRLQSQTVEVETNQDKHESRDATILAARNKQTWSLVAL